MGEITKRLVCESRLLALLVLATVFSFLVGCVDFGHTGVYTLAPAKSSLTFPDDEHKAGLQQTVRQTLLKLGFKEAAGRKTIWLKDGATVLLEPAEKGGLRLTLTSMGSASQVQSAMQIERELVKALQKSQLTVTPETVFGPETK